MAGSGKFMAVWERIFLIAGNVVFFMVFCILAATDDRVHRNAANWRLLVVNLLILAVLCAVSLFAFRGNATECSSEMKVLRSGSLSAFWKRIQAWKHPVIVLLGIYLLLFALQCVFVHFTYFYTGWDVDLVKWRVEGVLEGYSLQDLGGDDYLSICPNNLLVFYVQYLLAKIGELFSLETPYNMCFYASCFCVSASCFFGNLIVRKMTQSGMIRLLYDLTGTVFILFSPWIGIPYSDTYGMLFATVGVWAVCCLERPVLKWPVTAFAALIGYQMKPTCIFPLFAAIILYLPGYLPELRRRWKELMILLLSCLVFWGAAQGIVFLVQYNLSFRLDPEQKLPVNHYIMMGLNTDTSGGFSAEDRNFAVSIPTYEEKKRLTWEEIAFRWEQMTASQKKEHYLTKLIYIMNNGTFSWGDEGVFFFSVPEHDNSLNDVYREVFYPEGKYFTFYCELAQIIWLQILLGIVLLFLDLKNQTFQKAFLVIVLCGLLTFLMLFEARARYLILYSPAFLILSLHGYEGLFSRILRRCTRGKAS
ncbi:MAG: hypothetical protein K2P59_02500 [Acetatifactor sp.]|nr:hypothetical protein [Acetatifactor sp.]